MPCLADATGARSAVTSLAKSDDCGLTGFARTGAPLGEDARALSGAQFMAAVDAFILDSAMAWYLAIAELLMRAMQRSVITP